MGVDAKVKAAVDALVAGAPDALDTLIELANALNNDPNFATTMATELGKKLNISDIVNNLTSGGTNKVLSAEQGKALKAALDSHNHDSRYELIITKLTAFNKDFGTSAGTVCEGNDARLSNARTPLAHTHKKADISDFPTSMPASDVSAWAKAASKPSYTASEVGASPSNHNHAGTYEPAFTKNSAFNKNFGSEEETVCEGNDARLSDTRVPKAHTHKVSDISDFPSSMPASDVSSWAKQPNKPSYTASEVGASPSNHNHAGVYQPVGSYAASSHTHGATDITPDSIHRFVTDTEKRRGTAKLRETIITIQCIKLKVVMLLHHIVMMRRILTKIVRIDLSRIQKRQIGIVRLQEITTTIQYTNLRVVMLQVLINIQRRTLKKIRLIVL